MGETNSILQRPVYTPITYLKTNNDSGVTTTKCVIWLDNQVNAVANNVHAQQKIYQITNNFRTFENPHECQKYIQTLPVNQNVILIVSGRLGEEIVPHIHSLKQITSIYVFCVIKERNERWARKYEKIKVVTVQLSELLDHIRNDLCQSKKEINELMPMDIFITNCSTGGLDAQYVYFLRLIDILVQLKSNESDRTELIALCKQDYRGQEIEEFHISEFERSYTASKALSWYTKESFLYKMLNKALRNQDYERLFLFRWFIADIHRLLSQYQCQCKIHVYRGQLMATKEIERLKQSIGKVISFNSFLSASLIENKAVSFKNNIAASGGLQRVLFEIDANPEVVINRPFADLTSHSDFDGECEILFMLGCVFRIDKVYHRGHSQGWFIHMTLFDESDHHISERIEAMKSSDDATEVSLLTFANLLYKIGKYDLAEKYFQLGIAECHLNYSSLGEVYLSLGLISSEKGNHTQSLQYYEKALAAYTQQKTIHHSIMGVLYNNIGEAYRQKHDYVEAMNSYQTALSIFEEANDAKNSTMGLIYNNIGLIHHTQENLIDALHFYEKSRSIFQENYGSDHRRMALAYNNIGAILLKLENLDLALEYFERAIRIYLMCLPPSHPDIALTYHNIGAVHERRREFAQAWQYYQQALEIRQRALGRQHSETIEIERCIQRIAHQI